MGLCEKSSVLGKSLANLSIIGMTVKRMKCWLSRVLSVKKATAAKYGYPQGMPTSEDQPLSLFTHDGEDIFGLEERVSVSTIAAIKSL
jgi:hypothetical protein